MQNFLIVFFAGALTFLISISVLALRALILGLILVLFWDYALVDEATRVLSATPFKSLDFPSAFALVMVIGAILPSHYHSKAK